MSLREAYPLDEAGNQTRFELLVILRARLPASVHTTIGLNTRTSCQLPVGRGRIAGAAAPETAYAGGLLLREEKVRPPHVTRAAGQGAVAYTRRTRRAGFGEFWARNGAKSIRVVLKLAR